jgi:protocatechuate 3,4-dioxygenase beta subunit
MPLLAVLLTLAVAAPASSSAARCTPTRADSLGPFYVPNAPVRAKVGTGHVLTGAVRSSRTCRAIPRARVELWLAGPEGEYGPAWRATLFSRANGSYRFESHFPSAYSARPPHVHVRVSARGFRTLVTQYYPRRGQTRGALPLVLRPG